MVIAVALSGPVGLAIGELIQTSLLISALTFSSKRTSTDRERSSVLAMIQTHCYTYLRYTHTLFFTLARQIFIGGWGSYFYHHFFTASF